LTSPTLKSPIKDRPLHNPGESLQRAIHHIALDQVLYYVTISGFFIALAGIEWMRWYNATLPSPRIVTTFAALVVLFSAVKIGLALRKIKRLKLGLDGEKTVGQFLDHLRTGGAQVFHDIPGVGFNLDHVVIHPSGVYVIETKTWSKPVRGAPTLVYDGEGISKNGLPRDTKPIVQVRAARKWLAELLKESTGRGFTVRPVVLYPGWYIEPTAEAKASDVWVLNPKALPSFIANSKDQLQPDEVKLCAFHLARYVRTAKD